MVTIETKEFNAAIKRSGHSKTKFAALADTSAETLNKICNGDNDLRLTKIEQIADFAGLDVFVSFRPKAVAATQGA